MTDFRSPSCTSEYLQLPPPSRFIELLNLYVDREITPAEAAELEAEVQANEQRRRVYNQYCRIDRACTVVLAQGGKVPAPKLAAAIADADRKVEAFPEQTGGRSRLVFLGGMLAAAAAIQGAIADVRKF